MSDPTRLRGEGNIHRPPRDSASWVSETLNSSIAMSAKAPTLDRSWLSQDAAGCIREKASSAEKADAHFYFPRGDGPSPRQAYLAGRAVPSAPILGVHPHRHTKGACQPASGAPPGEPARPPPAAPATAGRYNDSYHRRRDHHEPQLLHTSESAPAPEATSGRATPRRGIPVHLRQTTGARSLIGGEPEPAPSGGRRYAGPAAAPAPYAGGPGEGRTLEFTPAPAEAPMRPTGRASGSYAVITAGGHAACRATTY